MDSIWHFLNLSPHLSGCLETSTSWTHGHVITILLGVSHAGSDPDPDLLGFSAVGVTGAFQPYARHTLIVSRNVGLTRIG